MQKNRDRPQNGPGANSLRGGVHGYSSRTVLANWQEDLGGPQGYKPGFVTEDFLSTSQRQQLGNRRIPMFGSALPEPESILNPPLAKDLFQPSRKLGSEVYESTTAHMLATVPRNITAIHHEQSTGCNLSRPELEEYRGSWTHDTVESKRMRFVTESKRMTQNAAKFKEFTVRMPAGSPGLILKLREQMQEKFGVLAFSKLRAALDSGIIHVNQLFSTLTQLGLKFTRLDYAKMTPFFTTTYEMPSERVLRVFQASTSGFEDFEPPEAIFDRKLGKGRCSVEEVAASVCANSIPEIAQGVVDALPSYSGYDGLFGPLEFSELLHDLFLSAPIQYENIIRELWK